MKNLLLSVLIVSLVGILMVSSAVAQAPGAPPEAGKLGDEHEHASMLVRIFGDKFDFLFFNVVRIARMFKRHAAAIKN